MRDVFRSLLAAALVAWAASCSLNDCDLGANAGPASSGAAGRVAGAAGATAMGAAGTSPDTSGAAGALPVTGTGGATGAAGASSMAGAAGTSPTGAAGDASTAGAAGTSSADGAAGTSPSGAAGTSSTGGGAGASTVTGAAGQGSGNGGSAGGGALSTVGCSDGTREGYLEISKYPAIAACAGAWDEPGLISAAATSPQCARKSGNDGAITDGQGCSAADLCAAGWHVCDSAQSLANVPGGCGDATAPFDSTGALVFFATRQRAQGQVCTTNGQGMNNVYGCGTFGSTPDHSCQPLDRFLHDSDCANNAPWACSNGPIGTSQSELADVTKTGPSHGGVLCCKN